MFASEIDIRMICQQARIEPGIAEDPAEERLLTAILNAAFDYVKSYTGLTDEEMDEHEDLANAILVIAADMYDNREMTVDRSNINRVVQTILGMHSVNLL